MDEDSTSRLNHFVELISCIPTPMCLLDKKGFIHYANPEFSQLIDVRRDSSIEDFLHDECIPQILKTLQLLAQKEERKAYAVHCRWKESHLQAKSASSIKEYRWDIVGARDRPMLVLCGR